MPETTPGAPALSIQQPWAWLIVNGYKDVENRTWPTKFRGRIQVHAGKRFDYAGWEWVRLNFPEIPFPPRGAFQTGGLVGCVEIVDCVQRMDSPWFCGPYGFVLEHGCPLPFVSCRGRLGFFHPEVLIA